MNHNVEVEQIEGGEELFVAALQIRCKYFSDHISDHTLLGLIFKSDVVIVDIQFALLLQRQLNAVLFVESQRYT